MVLLVEVIFVPRENGGSVHIYSFAFQSYKGHLPNFALLTCKLFLSSRREMLLP